MSEAVSRIGPRTSAFQPDEAAGDVGRCPSTRHGQDSRGTLEAMADSSFDIVSELNLQEMDNAITQAQKEIGTRYDFKGTAASVEFDRKGKELTFTADAEQQLDAVRKVVVERMIKRGV